jgi:hypothetical protein
MGSQLPLRSQPPPEQRGRQPGGVNGAKKRKGAVADVGILQFGCRGSGWVELQRRVGMPVPRRRGRKQGRERRHSNATSRQTVCVEGGGGEDNKTNATAVDESGIRGRIEKTARRILRAAGGRRGPRPAGFTFVALCCTQYGRSGREANRRFNSNSNQKLTGAPAAWTGLGPN